jgi:two-component system sensor histidine kinase DesK
MACVLEEAPSGAAGDGRRRTWPLLPPYRPELGWIPYLWLSYIGFFFVGPVLNGATPREWLALAGVIVVFVPLYFLGYWARTQVQLLLVIGAITLLGLVYTPLNPSSGGLYIYAGAFVGFGFRPARAVQILTLIFGLATLEAVALSFSLWAWLPLLLIAALVSAGNIHFAEMHRHNERLKVAREEVEHLAKVAERERIARDLHDVLGHTLTVIAVKSELADKLSERDPARSREEIREVHEISRKALSEVRRAVQGYRSDTFPGLEIELATARHTLASSGIEVEIDEQGDARELGAELGPPRETALVLALREGVTNVLRHARARRCRVSVARRKGRVVLEVADDGRGGLAPEGSGLTGMRERIQALGGRVARSGDGGHTLRVELPPAAAARAPEPAPLPAAEADG